MAFSVCSGNKYCTVPTSIWEDNIKIYVAHGDGIYLAPDNFHSENATNTLLGVNFDVRVTAHP